MATTTPSLVPYDKSSDDDDNHSSSEEDNTILSSIKVNAAPAVPSLAVTPYKASMTLETKELTSNRPYNPSDYGPALGPAHPDLHYNPLVSIGSATRTLTGGAVEETFETSAAGFEARFQEAQQQSVSSRPPPPRKHNSSSFISTTDNRDGIWATEPEKTIVLPSAKPAVELSAEQQAAIQDRITSRKRHLEERNAEDSSFDRLVEKKKNHLLPPRLGAISSESTAKSTWHDIETGEVDYQGRSWIEAPKGLRPVDPEDKVYLPKKCIHTWMGHHKGVQAIEFSPKTGHLLLSGSLDGTCKIWDVYNDRALKRTYDGHTAAVRSINFSNDGRRFLSCSFDRYVRLWDTETGKVLQTVTNRRVPYVVKFYPKDNNLFVIGDSNNMIVQFDATSGQIVQEYNHHLQAVNSITFCDDDRRFVSTSDDKKILIWEWNIPVPIKYIAEPFLHSMPAVTLHPSGDYFAGQSLNNKIDVYEARDKFKHSRKKVFTGHSSAGYACQIGFSPNGQYIMSGDAGGRLFFWDWQTTKLFKKMQAHDKGPIMGAIWHPIENSRVATCGWDGLIKFWD